MNGLDILVWLLIAGIVAIFLVEIRAQYLIWRYKLEADLSDYEIQCFFEGRLPEGWHRDAQGIARRNQGEKNERCSRDDGGFAPR